MKRILYFFNDRYEQYPLEDKLKIDKIEVINVDEKVYYIVDHQEPVKLQPQQIETIHSHELMLLSDEHNIFEKTGDPILIGSKNCDIQVQTGTYVIDKQICFIQSNERVYLNGRLQCENQIKFHYGDQLLLGKILIIVQQNYIEIIANSNSYQTSLTTYQIGRYEGESFPKYHRSPRIIKRLKEDQVTIQKPQGKRTRKKGSIVKVIIPPIVMMLGTIATSLMMGRGIYILFGLAGTMVSVVFSATTFLLEQKEIKDSNVKKEFIYQKYLLDLQKRLNEYRKNEVEALRYNHPNSKEIEKMIHKYHPRIYERDVNDSDFLTLLVGTSTGSSQYTVCLDYNELDIEKDELLEEAKKIYDAYQKIENKPTIVDLKKAHLGVVGKTKEVHEQIHWYLLQLTFFHSYHDVQIVMFYNEKFKNEYDYIKWYPHVKIRTNNLTGNICMERIRDQVLSTLYQILKERKNKIDENRNEMRFLPHFIIIVDDMHMIMDHIIMEYLQKEGYNLGFSLIYTAQKRANLPEKGLIYQKMLKQY